MSSLQRGLKSIFAKNICFCKQFRYGKQGDFRLRVICAVPKTVETFNTVFSTATSSRTDSLVRPFAFCSFSYQYARQCRLVRFLLFAQPSYSVRIDIKRLLTQETFGSLLCELNTLRFRDGREKTRARVACISLRFRVSQGYIYSVYFFVFVGFLYGLDVTRRWACYFSHVDFIDCRPDRKFARDDTSSRRNRSSACFRTSRDA